MASVCKALHAAARTDTTLRSWTVGVATSVEAGEGIDVLELNPDWDGAIPVTIIYNKEDYEIIKGEFDNYEELNTIVKSYLKI